MIKAAFAVLLAVVLAAGCMLLDVKPQQAKIDALCLIKGNARAARSDASSVVVLLVGDPGGQPRIENHFVLESAGTFVFLAPAGTYRLAAFEDANRDLIYQPGESLTDPGEPFTCAPGGRLSNLALTVPATPGRRITETVEIAKLQARTLHEQVNASLGQLTAVGELIKLSDPRFSQEVAEGGLWRPFDFVLNGYAGLYFLEPYDAKRVPVVFVHGINGTPASFDYLADKLDRKRFQAWVYYYPSGVHLEAIADHLFQTLTKLRQQYGFERFALVAHSMGGLVTRGAIVRHPAGAARIPLYITISTPWGGHKSAESGVKNLPMVVRVWEDMVPGSPYQKSIFARPLPAGMQHHLMFTFQRKSSSFGESDDQAVTVASQLFAGAQGGATRVYGFDDTHVGILRNAEVSALLNQLLARSF